RPRSSTRVSTARKPIASRSTKAKLLVGTCSWTDPTLIESGWYPERIKDDPDKRLRYYAEHFPIVENDAAFYALPAHTQALMWAERTPDEFVMNFKAFATLTTHPTDPKRLPKDIREALPKESAAKRRIYPKDFPKDVREELLARHWVGLEPLRRSENRGGVPLQDPEWFAISKTNKEEILHAREL